ncbi:MAG: porin family protein [Bacteroidetes bacterium]|nr:porin family protein [Bacteroidota bacterium]
MFKLAVTIAAVMAIAGSVADAQTVNVTAQGNKAVLFNFSGLSNLGLGAYQGGVGGKYYISDGMAVRGMLDFAINNQTTKGAANFTDATDNTLGFGLGAGLEYHLPLASKVSPYFGGLVSFMTTAETFTPSVFTGTVATSTKTSTTTFGLGALAGVEYFFNQNISLAAEYQFGLNYSSRTNPSVDILDLGFQTAGLTFAVYF